MGVRGGVGKDGLTKAEGSETDEDGLKVGRPSSRGGNTRNGLGGGKAMRRIFLSSPPAPPTSETRASSITVTLPTLPRREGN